jgi:hypothetical protein
VQIGSLDGASTIFGVLACLLYYYLVKAFIELNLINNNAAPNTEQFSQ